MIVTVNPEDYRYTVWERDGDKWTPHCFDSVDDVLDFIKSGHFGACVVMSPLEVVLA